MNHYEQKYYSDIARIAKALEKMVEPKVMSNNPICKVCGKHQWETIHFQCTEVLEKQIDELKAILTFLISQHNVGNLHQIDHMGKTGEGKYYDIEIKEGKISLLNH